MESTLPNSNKGLSSSSCSSSDHAETRPSFDPDKLKRIIDAYAKAGCPSGPNPEFMKATGHPTPVLHVDEIDGFISFLTRLCVSTRGRLINREHNHSGPLRRRRWAPRRGRRGSRYDDNQILPACPMEALRPFVWTPDWHRQFLGVVERLGGPHKALAFEVYEILRNQVGHTGPDYADVSRHLAGFQSLLGRKPMPSSRRTNPSPGPLQSGSQPAGPSGSNCGAVDSMMDDLADLKLT